jgi:hypothetical protein
MVVDFLQNIRFPQFDNGEIDTIIRKCWHRKYESIKSLKIEMNWLIRNTDIDTATLMKKEDYQAKQWECEQLVKNGVLHKALRGPG